MSHDNFKISVDMNKILLLSALIITSVTSVLAGIPEKAIPFILDSHVYIQGIIRDTIPVSLIYDTGADRLYMDKDYMRLSAFGKLPLKKGKARMGGAGNDGAKTVDIIMDSLTLRIGNVSHTETVTPIINLREILGRHTDGMVGNNAVWDKPLIVNYSYCYLLQVDTLTPDMLEGYAKLPAHFDGNRVDVDCELAVDSVQILKGRFRLDLGCGSTIVLTNATRVMLDLDNKKKAVCYYSNMGVGGDGTEVNFRVDSFKFFDELSDIVVSASCNTQGALSDRQYLGLIGNEILRHYDLIIDAPHKAVYVKKNSDADKSYQESSTLQMGYVDRTDICNGWIVSSMYEGGIAQNAGFEIDDIILEINGRPVKSISWEEQRMGLGLKGDAVFKVQKKNGDIVEYAMAVGEQII